MVLELIIAKGNLKDALAQIDPATVLHSAELMNERRTNEKLRWGFWTADFPLYTVEKGEAVLYLGNRDNNLVFKNIDEAFIQLRTAGNYKPKPEDAEKVKKVIKAKSTLRVVLSELELIVSSAEWGYFEIDTEKYDRLNPAQILVTERVYGSGTDLVKNIKMLREEDERAGRATRIYFLTHDYVKKHAEESPIARVCLLNNFYGDSVFYANVRDVDYVGALCGVSRKAVAGWQPALQIW